MHIHKLHRFKYLSILKIICSVSTKNVNNMYLYKLLSTRDKLYDTHNII